MASIAILIYYNYKSFVLQFILGEFMKVGK